MTDDRREIRSMEKGYVSSFDLHSASGFIRPSNRPERLVSFHQSDLDEDAGYILKIGQEVRFETTDQETGNSPRHWDRAKDVRIPWSDDPNAVDDPLDSSLPPHLKT